MEQWSIKYQPKKFTEMFFSTEVHVNLLKWIKTQSYGVCNINGPCGSGKTTLAKICAKICKYNPIEIDQTNIDEINNIISRNQVTLNGGKNCLIVDECCLKSSGILKKLKMCKMLVICTTTELFLKDITMFKIDKISPIVALDLLKTILSKEGKQIPDSYLLKIIDQYNGDIRSMINMMQINANCIDINNNNIKEITTSNVFNDARNILLKRIKTDALESIYNPTIIELLLNSLLSNSKSLKQITSIYNSLSDCEVCPIDQKYISLKTFNYLKLPFVYKRMTKIDQKPYHLDRCYYRRLFDIREARNHLQKILRLIDYKYLSDDEKEILKLPPIVKFIKENKTLRYKVKKTAPNAIKNDISLKEFMEF